ncbi:MAG: hypothetical protein HQL32_14040 [Planctomycetes bacterium]|nr:hypothetical protein [Planctomycetota bacterium]
MRKIALLTLLPLVSGCACTNCFVDEVKHFARSETSKGAGVNELAVDFAVREFGISKGLGKDIRNQFRRETGNPEEYINDISQIFCPWE